MVKKVRKKNQKLKLGDCQSRQTQKTTKTEGEWLSN